MMPPQITSAGSAVELHGYGKALDHVGAMAGDRCFGHHLDRAEIGPGVVLRDPDQEAGDDKSRDAAQIEVIAHEAGAAENGVFGVQADEPIGQRQEDHERQDTGCDQALVERAHDAAALAELDEERAGDRGEDAGPGDRQREEHHRFSLGAGEEDRCQHHGRDGGHHIGLEQVCRHAGAIADIVAHVVGDGRRVSRIILGDARFDLAHHVAADVGALGEDAAAETGEDRDQRCAEAERDKRVYHGAAGHGLGHGESERAGQKRVVAGNTKQSQADHEKSGHGAGFERHRQAFGQTLTRRFGGANIGAHGHVHADIARGPRQRGPDEIADGDLPSEIEGRGEDDRAGDRDGHVLAVEICARAFLNRGGDLLHLPRSRTEREKLAHQPGAIDKGHEAASENKAKLQAHSSNPYVAFRGRKRAECPYWDGMRSRYPLPRTCLSEAGEHAKVARARQPRLRAPAKAVSAASEPARPGRCARVPRAFASWFRSSSSRCCRHRRWQTRQAEPSP